MQRDYFLSFARYNRWANGRLYDAAATLPADALARHRPAAFFRSLIGTLNHVLVADRIWLARFEKLEPPHRRLDEEPYPQLAALRAARESEDARIEGFFAALTDDAIAGEIAYANTRGVALRQPLWQALGHFFNHQTHHRGQAHALLKEAGVEPPPLDLLYYLRPA